MTSHLVRLELKEGVGRHVKAGHPWVFKKGLAQVPRLPPGSVVDLVEDGRFVARGYFDPLSAIAVRVLTRDPREIIDSAFFTRRVESCLRALVALPRPAPPTPPSLPGLSAPLSDGPRLPRPPRLDWAALQKRTFGDDVFRCPCGGRRSVVAVVTDPTTIEEVLENLGLLARPPSLPSAQAPPQLSFAV